APGREHREAPLQHRPRQMRHAGLPAPPVLARTPRARTLPAPWLLLGLRQFERELFHLNLNSIVIRTPFVNGHIATFSTGSSPRTVFTEQLTDIPNATSR